MKMSGLKEVFLLAHMVNSVSQPKHFSGDSSLGPGGKNTKAKKYIHYFKLALYEKSNLKNACESSIQGMFYFFV